MDYFLKLLNYKIFNNTGKQWLIALLIFIITWFTYLILKRLIFKKIANISLIKNKANISNFMKVLSKDTKLFIFFILSIYIASRFITLPQKLTYFIQKLSFALILIQIGFWINHLINLFIDNWTESHGANKASSLAPAFLIKLFTKVLLWITLTLVALDNIGLNITALIGGLGIGGIAIALALQNVLGDLFASLSIILDKPFVIGDFIIINEYLGTVEHIGLKTTRVRSLSGEQLIIGNSDLLKSRIRNYKRMYERRVVFTIGVTYQTSHEKLEKIPSIIKEIINSKEKVRFDRAHFSKYADFSLNFEVVYWVLDSDYNKYMDVNEKINLEIHEKFSKEKIDFAYPTQELFLNYKNKALEQK